MFQDLIRHFLSVLDEVILPSLSLLLCNCGIAEEVWAMVKLLPYATRSEVNSDCRKSCCPLQCLVMFVVTCEKIFCNRAQCVFD